MVAENLVVRKSQVKELNPNIRISNQVVIDEFVKLVGSVTCPNFQYELVWDSAQSVFDLALAKCKNLSVVITKSCTLSNLHADYILLHFTPFELGGHGIEVRVDNSSFNTLSVLVDYQTKPDARLTVRFSKTVTGYCVDVDCYQNAKHLDFYLDRAHIQEFTIERSSMTEKKDKVSFPELKTPDGFRIESKEPNSLGEGLVYGNLTVPQGTTVPELLYCLGSIDYV